MAEPSPERDAQRGTAPERYVKGRPTPAPVARALGERWAMGERQRNARAPRLQWALFAAIGAAIMLAAGALALVVSGPWDGQTRVSLGSAVITGLIVGVALALIERSADQRRKVDDREKRERLFGEAARDAFARLLVGYIEMYWSLLQDYLDDAVLLEEGPQELDEDDTQAGSKEEEHIIGEAPSGYENGDTQKVWGALAWSIERSSQDVSWWKDTSLFVKADALAFVATDLLERNAFPRGLGKEWRPDTDSRFQSVAQIEGWEIVWLSNLTQRLLELDDAERAFVLDNQVRVLRFHTVPAYGTGQPNEIIASWKDKWGTARITTSSLVRDVRNVVAWLVDRLRDDAVPVDGQGHPIIPVGHPVTYRWGPILGDDEAATAWDRRFMKGSWFRRLLDTANQEYREILLREIEPRS
jgi:hypothetical protein